MASPTENPLMSSQKSSELQAVLHPLVLLTISDYITRHTLRSQEGPIVGALLGQQNGREVTIEHAFECHLKQVPEVDGGYLLDADRFGRRLEQMKLVHKDRGLDLVGWYTLLPSTGPTPTILPIHNQVLADFNESALILGFHPQEALSTTVGGKLPMTILESNYEVDDASKAANDGEDKKMEDGDSNKLKLRFRELPYTVETGEAEMISMDHVARGAGNATAIEAPKESKPKVQLVESGGKRRVVVPESADQDIDGALSPEEEEMIASLTAKANAVKMLQGRIRLITSYLERLPSEYLPGVEQQEPVGEHTTPSHTILRQIQALVNRLELVVPSDVENFEKEVLCEENDVAIVSRLNDLMQSISGMRDLGKKFGVLEVAKNRDRRAADFTTAYSVGSSGYNVSGVGDVFM
ncbi:COP9 signalosome complex subunit 6 [Colletotrichum gloeosporioides]|uniref:COP9 signalosome complex subunit 6 n=2 Tax=Colletotrichum gloeosporioides TaxID=474922 RepID=T0KDQ2_COLGC|nr:COP9 signalosome complex subunit 6 [Colletotrichum gloeosporioides]EQB50244.1 signalosome subunit [Colletotrichum gloeosporioides Cg-14]KAF3806588.1 COP9 signalosome complex subunit 6 [Colletotrichum gloeosporioides]